MVVAEHKQHKNGLSLLRLIYACADPLVCTSDYDVCSPDQSHDLGNDCGTTVALPDSTS